MKNVNIYLAEKPNGSYTVKVVGQPNDHISDWRGTSFRSMVLPGIGRKNLTREVATALYLSIDETRLQSIMKDKSGSSISDARFAEECVDVTFADKARYLEPNGTH